MEKVTFGSGLPGFEIGDKTLPAIIAVQEWWGVTEPIKDVACEISKQGFRVLLPDLYKGKIGVDREEAAHLMGALDFKAAVNEIKEAAEYLMATGSPKVGITGFCMGGALTLAAAAEGAPVVAAVPFYGTPKADFFDVSKIKVPVMMQFGKLDNHMGFSDPDTATAVYNKIVSGGAHVELHLYPSAGHAFFTALVPKNVDTLKKINAPVPDREDVLLAADRLYAFFKQHLVAS